jgi:hypothetical protein
MNNTVQKMQDDLLRNLGVETPYFSLRHHLAVTRLSGYWDECFEGLEDEGYFPPTVAWVNSRGLKVKLYEGPFVGVFEAGNVEISSGGLETFYLPDAEERLENFRRTGDRDMLETKPVALPEKTQELIRVMQLLKIC